MNRDILTSEDLVNRADFNKGNGLLPAIVQHSDTGDVLMQGWMDKTALLATLELGLVTFYSRSKERLWTKGESSGNSLECLAISLDCDNDSLLVMARPKGPTCHTGTETCWHDQFSRHFLSRLGQVISSRKQDAYTDKGSKSYTVSLFNSGSKRIAQKVGEEGVECALAAVTGNRDELVNEAADLMFHLMVLLEDQELSLEDVQRCLAERHGG